MKIKFEMTDELVSCIIVNDAGEEQERKDFPLAELPDQLEDGEGFKSLKGYGFLKLMQDRNSDLSAKALRRTGLTRLSGPAAPHNLLRRSV